MVLFMVGNMHLNYGIIAVFHLRGNNRCVVPFGIREQAECAREGYHLFHPRGAFILSIPCMASCILL
jgi:hypothetical protein